jgi:lysylphosphatidylglycerol synthetase-like protein (DUF2156 family)
MPRSVREWIVVLWPAFMAACVLEILVFAGFDPHDIHLFGLTFESGRETVYSVAFLAFWAVTTVAGVITWVLAQPATPIEPGDQAASHTYASSSAAGAAAPSSRDASQRG